MTETEKLRQRLEQERSLSASNAEERVRNYQSGTGVAAPGTLRGKEIQRREDTQGIGDNLSDSFRSGTAAGAAVSIIEDEAQGLRDQWFPETTIDEAQQSAVELTTNALAEQAYQFMAGAGTLLGFREGDEDYDRTEKYDELTAGIPYGFHDEIVGNVNYAAALRARERVLSDLERGRRLANQRGTSSGLAILAGSLVDVDLPLTFMTGGGYSAARVARAGVKFSAMTRMAPGLARTSQSALVGASAGLQAGLASGAGQMAWNETADWTTLAETALMGTLMGAGLNGAMRGDMGLQLQAARDELHSRIARDDSNLTGKGMDVDAMPNYPLVFDSPSTAGAQQVPGTETLRIDRDALNASPRLEEVTRASEDWRRGSGWLERKRDGEQEWLERFITRGAGANLARDYAKLYSSESPTANFLAGAIFESPHGYGRGRATSAVLTDHYTKQIVEPTFAAQSAMSRWAKRNNMTLARSGVGVSDAANRQFSREVMLEVNARRQGRQYSDDPDVLAATEAYQTAAERALGIAKGREGQTALDGFDAVESGPYLPYRWNGRRLRDLIRNGRVQESSVVNALSNAYRKAGMGDHKDATAVAKAVVTRMRSQADGVSGNLQDLMAKDGRDFLEEMLRDADVDPAQATAIMDRITGVKEEAGKSSHAKHRNEVDLETQIETTDGSMVQIIDLMDDDLHGSWHRYARQMAGSAALARNGITNRAMRETMISAIQREQAALGEKGVDGDLIRAMFTHFDGGPISGYAFGKTNKGIGVGPALAKRLTNLSLLGKLGITQLGETGASMAAVGLKNWVDRGILSRLDPERLRGNKELLDDLAFITGRIGEDHKHFAPHLELDSMTTKDASEYMGSIQGWVGKAQWVQGYTSLFNQVRSWQQTTAALGIADKVVKGIRSGMDDRMLRRIENDFGLDKYTMRKINEMIEDGVIEIRSSKSGHEYVHRLNMDQWDADLADEFGSAITRSTNQQVQKSLAGEQDAWLHTEAGSMLMHLKTFPMQAATKQFARNMRFFDQENWAVLGMGLATAYMSLSVRDAIDGRDRDRIERAKAAFGYSNMTGFIPMGVDPMLTALGLEDMRFNQYGPHSEASVASLDVANRAMRIPGAAADYITGQNNGYDRQAMMAIPFMNSIGLSRMW